MSAKMFLLILNFTRQYCTKVNMSFFLFLLISFYFTRYTNLDEQTQNSVLSRRHKRLSHVQYSKSRLSMSSPLFSIQAMTNQAPN